jgi:hypothetical protein
MPTGSWRARSMLASSYCCPEKPFVLKIRPFVLKIQPFGKFPLVWAWWRSRILHQVVCTLLDNLDGVLPATMSPVHRCIGTAGTFIASYQYRAQLSWRLPSRRGWDAPELTQPLSSPQLPQPTPRGNASDGACSTAMSVQQCGIPSSAPQPSGVCLHGLLSQVEARGRRMWSKRRTHRATAST